MRSKRPLLALVSRSCSSAGQHWDHGVVGDDEENVLELKLAFNTTAWQLSCCVPEDSDPCSWEDISFYYIYCMP